MKRCPDCTGVIWHYAGCAMGSHGSQVGIIIPTYNERLVAVANALSRARTRKNRRRAIPFTIAELANPNLKRVFYIAGEILKDLDKLGEEY